MPARPLTEAEAQAEDRYLRFVKESMDRLRHLRTSASGIGGRDLVRSAVTKPSFPDNPPLRPVEASESAFINYLDSFLPEEEKRPWWEHTYTMEEVYHRTRGGRPIKTDEEREDFSLERLFNYTADVKESVNNGAPAPFIPKIWGEHAGAKDARAHGAERVSVKGKGVQTLYPDAKTPSDFEAAPLRGARVREEARVHHRINGERIERAIEVAFEAVPDPALEPYFGSKKKDREHNRAVVAIAEVIASRRGGMTPTQRVRWFEAWRTYAPPPGALDATPKVTAKGERPKRRRLSEEKRAMLDQHRVKDADKIAAIAREAAARKAEALRVAEAVNVGDIRARKLRAEAAREAQSREVSAAAAPPPRRILAF